MRLLLILAILMMSSGQSEAQNIFSPGFHFGELNIPDMEEKVEVGVHLDRFTEYGKPLWPGCDAFTEVINNDRKKYGLRDNNKVTIDPVALDQTMGFNLLAISYQKRIAKFHRPSVRIFSILGLSIEQPTKFLQNKFMHEFLFDMFGDPACHVPTNKTRTAFDAGLGFEANWWMFPIFKWMPFFGGVGAAGGTIHQEAFVQIGAKLECNCGGLSGMVRMGATAPGFAFKGPAIAGDYRAFQVAGVLNLNKIHPVLPDTEAGIYRTQGWLLTQMGHRIGETLVFINVSWQNGAYTAELTNDNMGGGDFGPTFGFRLQAQVPTLVRYGSKVFDKIGLK